MTQTTRSFENLSPAWQQSRWYTPPNSPIEACKGLGQTASSHSGMSPRPAIFISSVSKELRSARQLVANTLTFLGYEPVWQDIFGTEGGDLRQMLRQQIDQCKGVVQLIGHSYGAEPPVPDEEFGRVSYTQYEALYARKQGKKVWYLFMDESFPIDSHEPEPEELRQSQASYRNMLKVDTHLFHPLASREALEAGVLKLRDDLTQLRRGAKRWAIGVAAMLCFIAILVIWLVRGQGKHEGIARQDCPTLRIALLDRGSHHWRQNARRALPQCAGPRTQRQFFRRAQRILRISFLEPRSARSMDELFRHVKVGRRQSRCRRGNALFWRQARAKHHLLPNGACLLEMGKRVWRNSRRWPPATPTSARSHG